MYGKVKWYGMAMELAGMWDGVPRGHRVEWLKGWCEKKGCMVFYEPVVEAIEARDMEGAIGVDVAILMLSVILEQVGSIF